MCNRKRDFEGAALAQEELDLITIRYNVAKEEEGLEEREDTVDEENIVENNHVIQSRAELDYKLSELQAQVAEMISSKEFEEVSNTQKAINSLEELKSDFPSISTLEDRIATLKREFEGAISTKYFSKASKVQEDADLFNDKMQKETLEQEKFSATISSGSYTKDGRK